MSGRRLLLDTNILIYLAKKELELSVFASKNDSFYISVITYMECLGYPFSNKKDELLMTNLCNGFNQLFISSEVVNQTITIRKSHRIKLPDAILAATAICENMLFVTNNMKDFENIKDFNMMNPFMMNDK